MTAMLQALHFSALRRLMLACGLSLLGACSAPAAGIPTPATRSSQQIQLQGLLLLRGNAPHAQAILQTATGEIWELQGLSQWQIDQWQRRRVQVQGDPAPMAPGTGLQRPPQLRVESLSGLP